MNDPNLRSSGAGVGKLFFMKVQRVNISGFVAWVVCQKRSALLL